MGDEITIGVTEIVNNIEVTAQPNDQVIDINVTDNSDEVTLNVTPNVIEVNINKGSSYARWGSIFGNLTDQADLTNALFNKADLVDGKVPSYQLPSFVDDVIEVANYAALPTVGEIGKIYITLDTNKIYRWSGSIYIEIASNQAIWGAITGSLINQTDLVNALNLRVPYTGATADVNLGNFDMFASKYWLYDAPNDNYGSLHFTDGNFHIEDGDGHNLFVIEDGYIQLHKNESIQSNLYTSGLTAIRDHYLPDASGTLALTSQLHNAVTLGTANGLSLSGQVLSLGLAGASSTGALSSTDWNTFNNKQSALNGTGFVKISGTTISYDNSDYVPTSRTITINGVTQDLTANRSFTVASGVTSVFGRTGDVVAANGDYTTTQVTEGTNLYYTEARVNANANVAANTAARHSAVTIGTANGLSLSGQALSLALASGSTTGALSSTDWNTFNNKLSSLSGAVLTTTDQSITGTKTFNVSTSTDAILVNNSGGRAIRINNSTAGFGLLINNDTSSSAIPLIIQKNGATNFSVSDIGHISTVSIAATTIVKSGGTAAQILAADGTVITAGTNVTISGGTISASGGLSGSGTANFLPKFTGSSALGNSQIFDNGSSVMIGTSGTASAKLSVSHDAENLGAIYTSNTNTSNYVDQISINYRGVGKMISCRGATTAEVFTVSNVGAGYFAGNVGIGTTSPRSISGYKVLALNDTTGSILDLNVNGTLTSSLVAEAAATYLVSQTTSPIIFRVNGTDRAIINSAGNVGIGTTSPSNVLGFQRVLNVSGGDAALVLSNTIGNAKNWTIGALDTGNLVFWDGNLERLRITSGGRVGIGEASPISRLSVRGVDNTSSNIGFDVANGSGATLFYVRNDGNTFVTNLGTGIVYSNGGALTSTNPSDERLKDDITDLEYGLNEILKLRPVSYNWKNDTINQGKQFGFIAQEVQEVMPELISEFTTTEDEEEVVRLGLDKEGIYATLVNAIKEQNKVLEQLKSEIELLKQK